MWLLFYASLCTHAGSLSMCLSVNNNATCWRARDPSLWRPTERGLRQLRRLPAFGYLKCLRWCLCLCSCAGLVCALSCCLTGYVCLSSVSVYAFITPSADSRRLPLARYSSEKIRIQTAQSPPPHPPGPDARASAPSRGRASCSFLRLPVRLLTYLSVCLSVLRGVV